MLGERVEFPQDKRMRDSQPACKGAAVTCDVEVRGDEQTGLDRGQPGIPILCRSDKGEKSVGVGRRFAHAAFRRRKETMIDFEVGVSLSSPALPSGTSTFSSG